MFSCTIIESIYPNAINNPEKGITMSDETRTWNCALAKILIYDTKINCLFIRTKMFDSNTHTITKRSSITVEKYDDKTNV